VQGSPIKDLILGRGYCDLCNELQEPVLSIGRNVNGIGLLNSQYLPLDMNIISRVKL
jgi:hypothetical protein